MKTTTDLYGRNANHIAGLIRWLCFEEINDEIKSYLDDSIKRKVHLHLDVNAGYINNTIIYDSLP